ncbi:MAG: type 4a pilus biogenesis protein PilO [Planctomycetes bacterium]|nr:type 4a pilus biogenesis protein PilO [Planctomycetota bacterium]
MTSGSRKIVFFALLVALAYVSYAYMIKPANQHLAKEKIKVNAKRAKLLELRKATAAASDLTKQLEKVEEAIAVFESKLPPQSEIDKVLEDITRIVQMHGLVSKTIRTLQVKSNRGYIEQPLHMELDGNFNSYYSFLLELEKLDRITKIRELSLKKKANTEGETAATFVVSIFFQKTST